eukprot:TRINITY_DN41_c2_g4_i6.p1 TRINITY_DN41_c2_g4~~TRINITY_DN41_c2_g4_i6.p1  ORF type:complete len:912 (+),score=154.15 TRINITY_DN41_c2_g4_i6:163-2898(+)
MGKYGIQNIVLLIIMVLFQAYCKEVKIGIFTQTNILFWQASKAVQLYQDKETTSISSSLTYKMEVIKDERDIMREDYDIVLFPLESPHTSSLDCLDCFSGTSILPIFPSAQLKINILLKLLQYMEWSRIAMVHCDSELCLEFVEELNFTVRTLELSLNIESTLQIQDNHDIDISDILRQESHIVVSVGEASNHHRLVTEYVSKDVSLPEFVFLTSSCDDLLIESDSCNSSCINQLLPILLGSLCISQSWATDSTWINTIWNPATSIHALTSAEQIGSGLVTWIGERMELQVPIIWDSLSFLVSLLNAKCSFLTDADRVTSCVNGYLSNGIELLDLSYNAPIQGMVVSNACQDLFLFPMSISFLNVRYSSVYEWHESSVLRSCKDSIVASDMKGIIWPEGTAHFPTNREVVLRDESLWLIDFAFHIVGIILVGGALVGVGYVQKQMKRSFVCVIRFEDATVIPVMSLIILIVNSFVLVFNLDLNNVVCFLEVMAPNWELIGVSVYIMLSLQTFHTIVFNNSRLKKHPLSPKFKIVLACLVTLIVNFIRWFEIHEKYDESPGHLTYIINTNPLSYEKYCSYGHLPVLWVDILVLVVIFGSLVIIWTIDWAKHDFLLKTRRRVHIQAYYVALSVTFLVICGSMMSLSDPDQSDYPRELARVVHSTIRFFLIVVLPCVAVCNESLFSWKKLRKAKKMFAVKRELIPNGLFSDTGFSCENQFEQVKKTMAHLLSSTGPGLSGYHSTSKSSIFSHPMNLVDFSSSEASVDWIENGNYEKLRALDICREYVDIFVGLSYHQKLRYLETLRLEINETRHEWISQRSAIRGLEKKLRPIVEEFEFFSFKMRRLGRKGFRSKRIYKVSPLVFSSSALTKTRTDGKKSGRVALVVRKVQQEEKEGIDCNNSDKIGQSSSENK